MEISTDWVERPWGRYLVVHQVPGLWVKSITIKPWAQLSLQIHHRRDEFWHSPEGRLHAVIGDETVALQDHVVYHVPVGTPHRLINPTHYELTLTEVAIGEPEEDDIVRLEDDYGRQDGLV